MIYIGFQKSGTSLFFDKRFETQIEGGDSWSQWSILTVFAELLIITNIYRHFKYLHLIAAFA